MSDIFVIRNSDGSTEGRDPRAILVAEFEAAGHVKQPILKVIREKCLDCCCGQIGEVAKCTAVNCALWPYRMRSNPFTLIFAIRSRDLGQWQAAMEPNATSCCGE